MDNETIDLARKILLYILKKGSPSKKEFIAEFGEELEGEEILLSKYGIKTSAPSNKAMKAINFLLDEGYIDYTLFPTEKFKVRDKLTKLFSDEEFIMIDDEASGLDTESIIKRIYDAIDEDSKKYSS